jgi:hypothetical protein
MRKQTIIRLFVGSLLAGAGGMVFLVVAGTVLYRSDTFVMDGPDVVGVESTWLGWAMLGLAIIAVLVIAGAVIGQLAAWIGAVLNTAALPDKTWMIVLLVTGLLSLGFLGMLAYVMAGPDDKQAQPKPLAEQQSPPTFTTLA